MLIRKIAAITICLLIGVFLLRKFKENLKTGVDVDVKRKDNPEYFMLRALGNLAVGISSIIYALYQMYTLMYGED